MSDDDIDEDFALRLVAQALMDSLDLRPECAKPVLAEVRRERKLVFEWLRRNRGLLQAQ